MVGCGWRRALLIAGLALLLVGGALETARGQGPPSSQQAYEERYRQRIRQETLFGVYIPADVPEALRELYRLSSEPSRKAFAAQPETEAVRQLHFSLGRWIIHNWGFYGGSRLSHHLREQLQIYHPDDMARFLMTAFHRSLNQKPLNILPLRDSLTAAPKTPNRE